MIYTLLCLPYLLEKFNTRAWKIALWIITVGFTGIVAVSRIVVGAHYMSDVLFGGTIAFLAVMLSREVFICKFSHIKCFKKQEIVESSVGIEESGSNQTNFAEQAPIDKPPIMGVTIEIKDEKE
jgi:hypothetical protein